MGRFEPRAALDELLAQRVARPALARVLTAVRDEARNRAPETRVWVTMRDERVRRTHFETDGQVIPANLRFKLPKATGSGHDLARHPRDPNLPPEQRYNCRCDDPVIASLLRDSIHATDVTVTGTRATGSVQTRFPRAAESENGTSEDEAAHYMLGALREVAARLRAGQPL